MRASLDRQPDEVAEMFDGVARRYDNANDWLSMGQDRFWRRQVVRAVDPRPGELILDLAAGTGTSSEPLTGWGATVVPTDLSFGMVDIGKVRQPRLAFVNANGLQLPYADGAFDTVTISFGLRNMENTRGALTELRRVTKRGGRIVICEFSTPTSVQFRRLYNLYLVKFLPRIAKLASSNPLAYRYLSQSILAWPTQRGLADLMREVGWQNVDWKNLTGGIVALHRGTA